MEGKTVRGVSSPAKPALTQPANHFPKKKRGEKKKKSLIICTCFKRRKERKGKVILTERKREGKKKKRNEGNERTKMKGEMETRRESPHTRSIVNYNNSKFFFIHDLKENEESERCLLFPALLLRFFLSLFFVFDFWWM
jgi:hypothetical protein